jgi:YVTN family beta-propeller protein
MSFYTPEHRTLVVVSIASNAIAFIDTATNAVKHITYVGRSPHEAAFTQDSKEVWVSVRGEKLLSYGELYMNTRINEICSII